MKRLSYVFALILCFFSWACSNSTENAPNNSNSGDQPYSASKADELGTSAPVKKITESEPLKSEKLKKLICTTIVDDRNITWKDAGVGTSKDKNTFGDNCLDHKYTVEVQYLTKSYRDNEGHLQTLGLDVLVETTSPEGYSWMMDLERTVTERHTLGWKASVMDYQTGDEARFMKKIAEASDEYLRFEDGKKHYKDYLTKIESSEAPDAITSKVEQRNRDQIASDERIESVKHVKYMAVEVDNVIKGYIAVTSWNTSGTRADGIGENLFFTPSGALVKAGNWAG